MSGSAANSPFVERRQQSRIAPKGTAIVLCKEHVVHGRLRNMSQGGFLASTLVTAPMSLLGRRVDLEIRIDDPEARWTRAEGTLARIHAGSIAVTFREPRPALLRLVEAVVVASRARLRVLSVILVDENPDRRAIIAEGFRAVGCTVVETQTALEAVVRLGEATFEPDLIAVGESVPASTGVEMREFIARCHPDVKLIAIRDAPLERASENMWLLSALPHAGLADRIRSLLSRPMR